MTLQDPRPIAADRAGGEPDAGLRCEDLPPHRVEVVAARREEGEVDEHRRHLVLADDVLDRALGRRRLRHADVVAERVRAERVPLADDALDDRIRRAIDGATDDEERRLHAALAELIEHARRAGRVRSVVEGQDDLARAGGVGRVEPRGAGPHVGRRTRRAARRRGRIGRGRGGASIGLRHDRVGGRFCPDIVRFFAFGAAPSERVTQVGAASVVDGVAEGARLRNRCPHRGRDCRGVARDGRAPEAKRQGEGGGEEAGRGAEELHAPLTSIRDTDEESRLARAGRPACHGFG